RRAVARRLRHAVAVQGGTPGLRHFAVDGRYAGHDRRGHLRVGRNVLRRPVSLAQMLTLSHREEVLVRGFEKTGSFVAVALIGAMAAALPALPIPAQAQAQAQTPAQDQGERTIEQFACKDVMRDSGPNRDVAIAFLHGYLLGKSGSSKFNVDKLRAQSDAFIERCLENPGEKAVDAAAKVRL